jgi:hypothetical protein
MEAEGADSLKKSDFASSVITHFHSITKLVLFIFLFQSCLALTRGMEFETSPSHQSLRKSPLFGRRLFFFSSTQPFTSLLLQQPFSVPVFLVLEARYPLSVPFFLVSTTFYVMFCIGGHGR